MKSTPEQIQQALKDRDLYTGRIDGDFGKQTKEAVKAFQHSAGLYVDGVVGPLTLAALFPEAPTPAVSLPTGTEALPRGWLPKADIDRVIVHWTAGQHRASDDDRRHYHVLFEASGTPVRGIPTIDKNDASGARAGYAAHTLNCNTGSIGFSLCCMTGAFENPFSPGPAPMTQAQWDAMCRGVAQICTHYGIPVTERTVLTHAEVQGTLNIRQRGKWDITRIAFLPKVVGARACGDLLRRQVASHL